MRADGSLVAGVSLVERTLTAIPGIAQLQIVQETPKTVRAYAVGEAGNPPAWADELRKALVRDLGESIAVDVAPVSRIPQEANGKYRFAIRRF